jgi:predicted membrane chloride channel (bestrophin family)
MKLFRSLFLILNYKTIIITLLSLCATYLCLEYKWTADLPQTLIGIAVVFPIVFSIGVAYQRRENALKDYGNLKAHSRSIYLSARDWFDDENPKQLEDVKKIILELLICSREFFNAPKNDKDLKEKEVYRKFSELSIFIKELRIRGMAAGELSRVNQYLSKMVEAFESLKHISQYRTPITLRAYSRLFIIITPIIYAPYFAHIGKNLNIILAMVTPFLFSIVLVGLDNIQDHLENPFDQIGEDDIRINAEKLIGNLDL